VAEQVEVPALVPAARLQGDPAKVPAVSLVKLTVPVGVLRVPGDMSPTVAVQVEDWLRGTGEVQETLVLVAL
jgi:hypothetical protein